MSVYDHLIRLLCISVVISQVHGKSIAMRKDLKTRRCGVIDEDITWHKSRHSRSLQSRVVNGRWNQKNFTYAVLNSPKPAPSWAGYPVISKARVEQLARQAFEEWAPHCGLNFEPWSGAGAGTKADIRISFERGSHDDDGDGEPFDGPGRIAGHASYPTEDAYTFIHFDDDEIWVDGQPNHWAIGPSGEKLNIVNFYPTILHEIGHALGMQHLHDENSIMYLYDNPIQHLQAIDIKFMRNLYGISEDNFTTISPTEERSTSTEALPTSTDELPNSTEALPTSTDELPNSTEALPTSTEALPTSTDELPNSTEALPTSTEALPTSTEELPNSTEVPTYEES